MPRLIMTPRNSISIRGDFNTAAGGVVASARVHGDADDCHLRHGGARDRRPHGRARPEKCTSARMRMNEIAPHLSGMWSSSSRFNRTPKIEGIRLKDAYPCLFHELRLNGNQVPHPQADVGRNIMLRSRRGRDGRDNGESYRAIDLKEKAKKVAGGDQTGWSVWHGRRKPQAYARVYGRGRVPAATDAPCMTNFTKSERGKEFLVKAVLGFRGEDEYLSGPRPSSTTTPRPSHVACRRDRRDVPLEAERPLQSDDEQRLGARACRLFTVGEEQQPAPLMAATATAAGDESAKPARLTAAAHAPVAGPNINFCQPPSPTWTR